MPSSPPFDEAQGHRWFAIECNNAAWDLVEAPARTAADADRMLHLAHAAYCHWQAVGTAVNRQRALVLLAFAHSLSGSPEMARLYAKDAVEIGGTEPGLTTFDRCAAGAAMQVALHRARKFDDAAVWSNKVSLLLAGLSEGEQAKIRELMEAALDRRP